MICSLRLTSALLACAPLTLLLSTHAAAQDKPEKVCVEDAGDALKRALQYQRAIALDIAWWKSLEGKRLERARWSDADFRDNVVPYLRAVPQSALLLYAADKSHICAFLWQEKTGAEPIYARREIGLATLNAEAAAWRRAVASELAENDRNGRARLAEMTREPISSQAPGDATTAWSTGELKQELSRTLFPPEFEQALLATKSLTIVPIGAVSTLPIALLNPAGGDERVVDLFSVNYLLFAGEVRNGPMAWTGSPQNALIFGNPTGDLAAAGSEASVVADTFGGTLLSRGAASEQAYMDGSSKADLIYFASHGQSNTADPLEGGYILLSGNERLDGFSIQRHDLSAKLVVMSACQTGLGQVVEAGVIGLARSFLDAGAANTLMSSWNINDAATALLMGKFVRLLKQHPPAEALRLAQLEYEKEAEYKQPSYWAAFSVYGNSSVMSAASNERASAGGR